MKFPNFTISGRAVLHVSAIMVLGLALASTGLAQKNFTRFSQIAQATQAADASLEQCANGDAANPVGCVTGGGGNTGWVTGNVGFSKAHWAESQYLPYRMVFSGLAPGTHNVTIGYDVLKGSVHAIDFLGTYNITETTANPCAGISSGCSGAQNGDSQFVIPVDPDVAAFGAPFPVMPATGKFTMWGGTITAVAYVGPGHDGEQREIKVTFTTTAANPNPVLAWGGHIAWAGEWGLGNSAGAISGSPYHMRLIDLDGKGGQQDRSLAADAVLSSGSLEIIKTVVVDGNTNATSNAIFTFTASSNYPGPTNPFQLQDNGDQTDGIKDTTGKVAVILFGAGNTITVNETGLPPGWTIADVNCVEVAGAPALPSTQNSTKSPSVGPATIIVEEGEFVTCTFTNTFTTPTAAPASVMGRVVGFGGRGVSGARVTLWDTSTGQLVVRTTNSFGYYRFDNLAVSHFFVATVEKKGMTFANDTRSFTLEDNLFGFDFFAN